MERLARSCSKETDNFKKWDENMAFTIFYVEVECHVGAIHEDYPYMKLLNLQDEVNLEKHKKIMKAKTPTFNKRR